MIDHWDGVSGATEHRTTGGRAWCHDDSMWCYPKMFCPCCFTASPDWEYCPTCNGEGFVAVSGAVEQLEDERKADFSLLDIDPPPDVVWASEK